MVGGTNFVLEEEQFLNDWSKDERLLNRDLVEVNGDDDEEGGDDTHTLQAGVHRLLEDVEVGVVLGGAFNISHFVESVLSLDIDVGSGWLGENLVRGTHLKQTSTGVEVRVEDSLNDGLDLWSLNEIKHLELDGNLKGVSAVIILLKHDLGKEVLIVDRLNVLDDHKLDLVHELPTSVTQTEELFGQQEEELVDETHVQEGVSRVREDVVLEGVIEDLEVHDCQELLDTIEVENWKQRLRQEELGLQELGCVLITLYMALNGLACIRVDLLFESISEVEDDIVSVGLDSEGKEVDVELGALHGQVLE